MNRTEYRLLVAIALLILVLEVLGFLDVRVPIRWGTPEGAGG